MTTGLARSEDGDLPDDRVVVDADGTVATIGSRIRFLRGERRLTLQAVAERTGLSPSMLSLVERGKASPSIGTLVAICSALDVHMSDLFPRHDASPRSPVVRAHEQPIFVTAHGVTRRLAQADDRIEVAVNEYEPGTGSAGTPTHHMGFEYGLVLDGRLTVEVDGVAYDLGPGDAIGYASTAPHRITNPGRRHARAIWVNLRR